MAHLLAAAFASVLLVAPSLARAQEEEPELEAPSDAERELERVDAERALAGDLQIAGGVLIGAGLAALLGGSVGSLVCMADCVATNVVLGAGAGVAAIGLGLFVVATFLANDANERRRRILRDHFAVVPLDGGAMFLVSVAYGSTILF
jgi:hypothetical protein